MTRWWHGPVIRSPVFIWLVILAADVIASILVNMIALVAQHS